MIQPITLAPGQRVVIMAAAPLPTPAPPATNPAPGVYTPTGWDAGWKAARAAVSTRRVCVVGIGDSITAGQGSTDIMVDSWWARLRASLLAGSPACADHYTALYNAHGGLFTASPPVVIAGSGGADWATYFAGFNFLFMSAASARSPLYSCTPPYPVTGFEIVYMDYQAGTWTYAVDGGPPVGVVNSGANSFPACTIKKVVISGLPSGMHTLAMNSSGLPNGTSFLGVTAVASATGFAFANMGWPGMGLVAGQDSRNALADTGGFPVDRTALYQGYQGTTAQPTALSGLGFPAQPDLAIIALGVNDANQGVPRAAFRDALDRLVWSLRYGTNDLCSIIIAAMYTADGTLGTPASVANMDYQAGQIPAYRDIKSAMMECAQANLCAFADIHTLFGRQPVAGRLVTSPADIHPTPAGHAKIAGVLAGMLS